MFEQIKKDSPDAFKVWNNYISQYDQLWDLKPLESVIGWLFTFFDKQGIYIVLNDFFKVKPNMESDLKWTIGHYDKDGCTLTDIESFNKQFESRSEAWQAAIPKAFEILQKQLEEKW